MTVDVLHRAEDIHTYKLPTSLALQSRVTLAILPEGYFHPEDQCSGCPEDGDVPPAAYLITYRWGSPDYVFTQGACVYCCERLLHWLLFHPYIIPIQDITFYA